MWFLPCEAASVRRDLPLSPSDIQYLPPLSDCELFPESDVWVDAVTRFRQIVRDVSPELVHAGPIPLGGFLTALANFHPALMMSWGSDVLSLPARECAANRIARFSLRRADMAISDCEAVRERIAELSGFPRERIVSLPWGADLKVFRPKRSSLGIRRQLGWPDCKLVICTRAFEAIHSPFVFLKAIQCVLKNRGDVRVLMLGDGSQKTDAESFIRANDLRSHVHLTSQVPEPALADYFAEADLYVSATSCDGSSISLLQAMACGLPAVVADGYGNTEWIEGGKNGWFFPAGDDKALAQAILEALANDDAMCRAGEMNIHIARARADWDRNFPRVLAAYDHLLAERHRSERRDRAEFQNR